MDTSKNDIWNSDFNFHDLTVEETNRQLKPILKLANEICGVPFSVIILTDKDEQKTLAKYGEWGNEEISKIQSICEKLGSEHDVQVINNLREHPDFKTIFRDSDLDSVLFYAGAPLISESGIRLGTLCMFDSEQRDLTESKKECLKILANEIILKLLYFNQEEAESVSKLKNKFQKVLDVATDLVYELEWDSKKLAWGDELTDILGYPNEERFVDYDWWLDKIHPDDLERVLNDVSMTVEGEKEKFKLVYRIRTFDGSYKYVINHKYIDRKEDGTPNKIIGAIVDMSDLKEAEDLASGHQKLLEELANHTSTAIWIRDREGNHLFTNQNFIDLFYLDKQKVAGKTNYDLFDKDTARKFNKNDQKVLNSGKSYVFEESVKTKMGKRFYKTNIFPISGGKVGGISVDITDEIQSREKLEDLVQEKETLLMEIHHRVKNNLAIVSGMLQLQSFKERSNRIQNKLLASVGRIKTIANIHELLYQSSDFTNVKLKENIRKLIAGITSYNKTSADLDLNFNLESIDLNINQAIPFSLIVNEVVTNVFKHAYVEGESGTVSVTLFEDTGNITLIIEDDGKGLPDGFDPSSDKDTLGLELIKTLASQLKAEYSYRSLDKGTQFTLTFERKEKKGAGNAFL